MTKLSSIDPSVFNLIILLYDTPLYCLNAPPTSILPSDCITVDRVMSSNPLPTMNESFGVRLG